MLSDLTYLFVIWLSTLIVGWASWPSAAFFLGKLSDRGYGFAKLFGWIAISYLIFLLATLKIVPLALWSIILVIAIWAAFNIFLEKKLKILRGKPFNFRQIVFTELLFIALMGFWALIRSFKPEIYGIERFMDFGFIQSLFNAHTLPLFDIWFSNANLNYYYFGHFISYIILSLSNIPPLTGFFVLVAWMFGLLGILVYRLGSDFLVTLVIPLLTKEGRGVVAGFVSLFTVLFAGTWYMTAWLFSYVKHVLLGSPAPTFWFSDPTRIMPGTITEIPLYGFLVADLHPHMWGLLNGTLVLAALYCLWRAGSALSFKNPYFWLLTFLLGETYMLNSWDVLTLGALAVAVFICIQRPIYKKQAINLLVSIILLAGLAYAIALPWSLFYEAPVAGVGLVKDRSSALEWISFWGFLVAIIAIFAGRIILDRQRAERDQKMHFIIIALAVFFLVFMELFYLKDILRDGEWFRANTVFKITSQLWLWLGVLAGSMIVWTVLSLKNLRVKIFLLILYCLIFLGPAIYPLKAIWQFQIEDRKPVRLSSGLQWWKEKFPADFAAYEYLRETRNTLPRGDKIRRIVEAEGESYTDSARFSVFLGWPTIIGWPVHEWTWRGSYTEVGSRRSEVRDIYTHPDKALTQSILEKYKIDYIIVGELEERQYGGEIKRDKLRELGKIVFDNEKTVVINLRE